MADFKKTVVVSVTALCEAFNRQATDGTFMAYEIGLEGLTAEQVQRATADALQTCRFMPAPAELRELAVGCGERSDDRALKAWHAVDVSVQRMGRNKTLKFDDPLINAAIRLCGGWLRFCDATIDEFDKWLKKEFCQAYTGLLKRPPGADLCEPNPGQFLRENGFHHKGDAVALIESGLEVSESTKRLAEGRDRRAVDIPRVDLRRP